MEKIIFSDSAEIYKIKLNMKDCKDEILKSCNEIIKNDPNNITDGFGYNQIKNDINFLGKIEINNKIDEIIQLGINHCINIHKSNNKDYNVVQTDGWVNVVRAKNPKQENYKEGKEKYHSHTDINKKNKSFNPTYTYVYYVQMPDNLSGEDGVIYFKDKNSNEFFILPEEDDLIIMPGDLLHAPNNAINSTKDRIVFAGNVGLDVIKKQKSLI